MMYSHCNNYNYCCTFKIAIIYNLNNFKILFFVSIIKKNCTLFLEIYRIDKN